MNLIRFLIIAAVVWLLISLLKRPKARGGAATHRRRTAGDMVRCAHCGLHVPEAEAVRGNGQFFCCPEHRALGRR